MTATLCIIEKPHRPPCTTRLCSLRVARSPQKDHLLSSAPGSQQGGKASSQRDTHCRNSWPHTAPSRVGSATLRGLTGQPHLNGRARTHRPACIPGPFRAFLYLTFPHPKSLHSPPGACSSHSLTRRQGEGEDGRPLHRIHCALEMCLEKGCATHRVAGAMRRQEPHRDLLPELWQCLCCTPLLPNLSPHAHIYTHTCTCVHVQPPASL